MYATEASQYADPPLEGENEGLEDGMLARDLPERTTFYDPVAERQMTQTDAKLFYQRSQVDLRSGSGTWTRPTTQGSPVIVSKSQPPTEYGADSIILEEDGGMYTLANLSPRQLNC